MWFPASQLATSLLTPTSCLWAQSRILTGSPGLGSPSSLPAPSCCSSASSQAGTSRENITAASLYLQHKQTTDKLQSLPYLGCAFGTVSHWVVTRGSLATSPGPMATAGTEKWPLTGTGVSKPDCSLRYEQKHLDLTTHLTVHQVILGIPSPVPGSCAQVLIPWISSLPYKWHDLGFPKQHRLSSLPVNKSILD